MQSDLKQLWARRALFILWLRYTIQARYTQAVLGILWIALLPLSISVTLAFVFTQVVGDTRAGTAFVVFLFAGQLPFNLFSNTILKARASLFAYRGIVKQVAFPREIVVLLAMGEGLVDFVFTFLVVLVVNAFLGVFPQWGYLALPIPLIIIVGQAIGVGLLVSAGSLYVRDLEPLLVVLIQLLFYLVVLIDPSRTSPLVAGVLSLNPLSAPVNAFRQILLTGQMDWRTLLYPTVLTALLLVAAYRWFKAREGTFADRL
jgi:ABC-type polysaccharide/polyol phosphate export permease